MKNKTGQDLYNSGEKMHCLARCGKVHNKGLDGMPPIDHGP